jgi:3-(3-hydroxy-phenyl)propionate hydroxylase
MDQNASSALHCDVAIVGLGPVGATLANILGQAGVSVVVLEREAAAYHLPRAVHFDDEVMRLFQSIGLAEALLPYLALSTGMRFLDPAGRIILDWSRLHPTRPQGWNASYRFHQPELEDVLRDGLKRWPSVAVRTRCEAFAVDQRDVGVVVRFEDLGSGRLYALNARYVVGCDGARSLIRRLIGSGLVDLGFHERWLVIDAILKRPRPDLGDISIQFCNPERPATYVRGVGERRRWEITLKDDEPTAQMTDPARVWSLLRRWITPDDAELERSAVYTFHSVIAENWRSGRLLIAGDAAHQTPPFLGQGMCAGMRDVANLGWKLVDVLRGKFADDLLDSYQTERFPHVREYIELAVTLGGIINTKAADVALPNTSKTAGDTLQLRVDKPRLGRAFHWGRSELIGRLITQPTLSDGARLDDRVGARFCLLIDCALAGSMSPAFARDLDARGIVCVDSSHAEIADWLRATGHKAVLARPDRYVFGAADNEAELAALIAAVGRNSPAVAATSP